MDSSLQLYVDKSGGVVSRQRACPSVVVSASVSACKKGCTVHLLVN